MKAREHIYISSFNDFVEDTLWTIRTWWFRLTGL